MPDCRVCHVPLTETLHLGSVPLVGFPATPATPRPRRPLDLGRCPQCSLVQMMETTSPDLLYREYWYRSGINERMIGELQEIVTEAVHLARLRRGDAVLDIGANDGTLLQQYHPGVWRVAFEPAYNLQALLAPHADVAVSDYWPPEPVLRDALDLDRAWASRFKIVTSIACFYDLDDPLAFTKAVREVLHPDGVWIIQLQDLLGMIQQGAFDNICHEHVEYYSLSSLRATLAHEALEVVDVTHTPINGGSLRVVVRHRGAEIEPEANERILAQIEAEYDAGFMAPAAPWTVAFTWRTSAAIARLRSVVHAVQDRGGTVDLYGASTKGHTLIHLAELDSPAIRQAIERDSRKVGRYVGGTSIPIVSEEAGRARPADLWVVPIWQWKDQVVAREAEYLARGGKMYFPLPHGEIVEEVGAPA